MRKHIYTCVSILLASAGIAHSQEPLWWSDTTNPILDISATTSNLGPANIGQAKWITLCALEALQEVRPIVADVIQDDLTLSTIDSTIGTRLPPIIDFTVPVPLPSDWSESHHRPLVVGQLKALSAPFYNRLFEVEPSWLEDQLNANQTKISGEHHPWTSTAADDENLSIAAIGQLKSVFSLRFSTLASANTDNDSDGLSNDWEWLFGFDPDDNSDALLDGDSDGISNLNEFLLSLNPLIVDSDGDGVNDEYEVSAGSDPTSGSQLILSTRLVVY